MSKGVRRTIVLLAVVTALVATATGFSSLGDGGVNGSSAFGGGRFGPGCFPLPDGTFCTALHRDFAVDVHQQGQGRVRGSISYGRNGVGTGGIQGEVHCIEVDGNRAAIGGITTPDGGGFVFYVTDNGPVGGATLDEVSLLFAEPLDAAGWPAGFPYVCPSPDDNPIGTIPLHSGNVQVRAT